MVTRKPFGPPLSTSPTSSRKRSPSNPQGTGNPLPYPTTPTSANKTGPVLTELDRAKTIHSAKSVYSPDLHTSPAFDLIDMAQARERPRRDSDVSSHGTWDESDDEDATRKDTPEEDGQRIDVPKPLRISKSQQDIQEAQAQAQDKGKGRAEALPPSLLPGGGQTPQKLKRKSTEGLKYEDEAQSNPWDGYQSPTSNGSTQQSNNPYRQQNGVAPPVENSQAAWASPQPERAPPAAPSNAPPAPPVELPTAQTPAEEFSNMSLGDHSRPQPKPFETAEILAVPQQGRPPLSSVIEQNQQETQQFFSTNPWRRPSEEGRENVAAQPSPSLQTAPYPEDDSLYAPPPGPPPAQQQRQQYAPPPGPPPKGAATTSLVDHPSPPNLPAEQQPSLAPIATAQAQASRSTDSVPETPGTIAKRQRSEHYQIKHVNWQSDNGKLRRSPILTQNANGPCPLLALVNALVLSTPQNLDTALIETLRTREQVSLGLLLDAVFDELMSGRRGDTAQELPDVSELYAFLLALHTGMNVNPRFVTPATAPRGSLDQSPPEKGTLLHPAERAQTKAGCFEETKEMRLYSTFNVPLIHGWTAPKNTPAYTAFERSAQSFEDAQNIQFAEAELEDKLRSEGLSGTEQQTLQDIQTIKSFLTSWPTQLSEYGLETISSSLKAGQIAILFRNDHFSTLYKEPRHGALMTLVTDAGYSSHEEIVWESLVDVNGAASEYFSGDFRAVSHGQDATRLNQSNTGGGNEGWTQVPQSRYRNQRGPQQSPRPGAGVEEQAPPLPGPRPTSWQGAPIAMVDNSAPAVTGTAELGVQTDEQREASEQEDHDLALALQLQEEEEDQQRQAEQRRRRELELNEQFLSTESTEGARPPIPPRRSGGTGRNSTAPPSGGPTGGRPAVNRRAEGGDAEAPPSYEQSASDRPYRPAGATAAQGMQQGNPLNAYNALRTQQSQGAAQSTTSVNSGASPSMHGRRASQGNRLRRQSGGMPGSYNGSGVPQSPGVGGRPVGQAAGVRDAEERCSVM